jgi:hypothetical protein
MVMTIEGVPEGWELVRIGQVRPGEFRVLRNGILDKWDGAVPSNDVYPVLRKIEKPKRYRPFANAEEFKPHRDRWTFHPNCPDKLFSLTAYDDDEGVYDGRQLYSYSHLFECETKFEDGTPFGVEVEE